jgi:hypothetical protein
MGLVDRHTFGMSLASELRRRYLYEGWTWAEPEEDARRRAGWPLWRRLLRPVGAISILAFAALATLTNTYGVHAFVAYDGAFAILPVIAAAVFVFGIVDGFRWRRAEKTRAHQ